MRRLATVLSLILALGCARSSSVGTSDAAGSDGGSAVVDASEDGSKDVGLFEQVWAPLPGAPSACGNILATNPASVPGLTWEGCPSGRTGCRRSTIPWTDQPGAALAIPDLEPIRSARGSVWFVYRRQELESFKIKRTVLTVQKLDGEPALAMLIDPTRTPSCLFAAAAGEYGIALLGSSGVAGGPILLASMPWGGSPTARAVPRDSFGSAVVQRIAVGTKHMFLEQYGPTGLHAVELPNGPLVPIVEQSEAPRAVEGGVLGQHLATGGIVLSRPSGSATVLRRPESGRVVSWISVDRTANAVVWVESVPGGDGTFSSPTLWTAPYAETEAAFAARKVGALPESAELLAGGRDIVANGGVVLVRFSDTMATIVRLSDGHRWTLASEPGLKFVQPLWVDDNEAILSTADAALVGTSVSRVLRIARSSLGAGA